MHKIHLIVWGWFFIVSSMLAIDSFIVLAHGDKESLEQHVLKYDRLGQLSQQAINIKKVNDSYILQVGPYQRNDSLALNYMMLKEYFPQALIIDEKRQKLKPMGQSIEKKVYVDREVLVEKEDDTLWIALFGMAIIGILFMFLSSDQLRRLKVEHELIKSKHKRLENKQHEVLSSMGENIHTLAKETMGHTSKLAEKVKETSLYEDMEKVLCNENELLDVTSDLIKFLRLKSKKVVIQNEVFNFNHVLNEVAGLLNNTYKQNDIELIFNIDKEVPRLMLADSLHLAQILTNLLEYFIQNSKSKEINLEVSTLSSLKEGLQLRFQIDADIIIEDRDTFFDSYYDEKSRRYIGLGLFVAKELTYLMDGELLVVDRESGHNSLVFTLPIEEKNKEKRKYRLPDKGLVGKKILIVDNSSNSAAATEKLFVYFRADVEVLNVQKFNENLPNFTKYDIIALNTTLFNFKILETLKQIKKSQGLKIISLENLFSSKQAFQNKIIDISLKKPLTQEYVFDTLIELYEQKKVDVSLPLIDGKTNNLAVNQNNFEDAGNINLESFSTFKGANVLIVEDNVINQKVVLSVLGKSEMILHVADNGQDAVDFMRNSGKKIDFIFMDINMPVMDGYRASELIRNDNRFDNVAIVALTALVSEHEISKMFDSGINGYLSKPVRIEKLYSALDMFLLKSENVVVSTPEKEPTVMNLEGLDVVDGLARLKNNNVFYKEVLKEFIDAYDQSDELFEKLIKEQRFNQVKMLCFDMKGLTGTIGATKMHLIINDIHQHLIYKKPELLHSYIDRYKETFQTLKKSIETYLVS